MKKEGSWISAFKRIFICSLEPKNINGSRKRSKKERGVKIRKQRCDDRSPFVTLFSGTSSIEKILEDVEKEQQLNIQATSCTREQETPTSASAPVPLQPHDQSGSPPQMSSICSLSPHPEGHRLSIKSEISGVSLSIITDRDHAALIIQTTYRGYMARRSLRALKGLVRLQGVVRGQNVKRQTTSAMKYMQLLFRAHFQVGSWRGEMMERLRVQRQQIIPQIQIEGDDQQRAWDDSLLLKGETEARLQRKGDAFISRQRVLSYSYSHKVLNLFMAPSSGTASSSDVKRAGFQWWWNRLESRVPRGRMPAVKISPRLSWPGDGQVATTPLLGMMRSMRAAAPLNRQAQTYTPARSSYCSNPRTSTWNEDKEEEEESFTSCPNFSSSPNYMTPTISAMAKARPTQSSVARQGRRLSYPLTPVVPSSKWNTALRSSISSSKESEPRRALGWRYSPLCLADEGTFSSPTSVVRIPFNRFV